MSFANSMSAMESRIDTGRVALAFARSSSALRRPGSVFGVRDPEERISVPSFSALSNSRCVCRRPWGLAYQFSSVPESVLWGFVDFGGIGPSFALIHCVSSNRPQSLIPNREHHDQITSGRRCSEKLPSFLALHIFGGNDHGRPTDSLLDFCRVNSMAA